MNRDGAPYRAADLASHDTCVHCRAVTLAQPNRERRWVCSACVGPVVTGVRASELSTELAQASMLNINDASAIVARLVLRGARVTVDSNGARRYRVVAGEEPGPDEETSGDARSRGVP